MNFKSIPSGMIFALSAACLVATGALAGVDPGRAYAPGEVIVKFRTGAAPARKALLAQGRRIREFRFIGAEHWKLGVPGVEAAVAALEADPNVEYAEPNYLLYALEIPDDPRFGDLWGLHNTGQADYGGVSGTPDADIDAVEAWDIFTGSSSVVVAVIDTGIDYLHPDLAGNIWTNPGEIPGNGLDDDTNGFIDDIHGWDFVNGDNDPMDDNAHGTHCAGTIGAVGGNGIGVAGVNRDVGIMGLKFLEGGGTGTTADAIACIEYATLMDVDVMSNSWGGSGYDPALEAAIQAAHAADIFFVAAAGNDGSNNDDTPHYPSNFDVANVISVMATNNRDQRVVEPGWWSSNYGATTVDIAAPGLYIWSTVPGSAYDAFSGTSMAAPHVAGALAIMRGRFPGISVADGRNLLLTGGNDPLPALDGLCVSGGRLNVLKLIADPDETPPGAVTDLVVGDVASNWLTLAWTAPGDDGPVGAARSYDVRYAASPIVDQAGWDAATPADGEPVPAGTGTPETMQVHGLDASTTYWFGLRAADDYSNVGDLSNSPAGVTLPPPTIAVSPASLSVALPTGGVATRTLTVANTGAGVLDFTIPAPAYAVPATAGFAPVPQHEYVDLAKGAGDTRPGFAAVAGSGGPDAFGYHWIDSDAPDGPAFDWIDISGVGTTVVLSDDSIAGPFELGFAFPFYGVDFTDFRIGSNGIVSFTSTSIANANSMLPAAGAPRNLLALFWDDLIADGGTVHYHHDGARMIVQFTDWGNYNLGGPYSMQVHLYPDGAIEYHYLSMTPPVDSATIGIQNGDGTDGLTVAFNAAYAHDNLAIRFVALPPWLSVSPGAGSLAAGASLEVAVDFDATGSCADRLEADIHILNNDPANPDVVVPVGLELTGRQDIAVKPAGLAFGPAYLTQTVVLDLAVKNIGCLDLTIHDVDIDHGDFTSQLTLPAVIAAGATLVVPVTFAPTTAGALAGLLTLASDDPDTPALEVPLGGTGLDFPDITIVPTSLEATLPVGGAATRHLTITNNGLGELRYTIPEADYLGMTQANAAPDPRALPIDLAKDEGDPRRGDPVLTGAGGPDAAGYRWRDSDEPGGPAFNWIEISGIGTPIPFTRDDQNLGFYDIGFGFPFYGTEFTGFRACSNGWLSFTNIASTAYTNYYLPSSSAPENLVAPFWDDLTFTSSGDAYYHFDGLRLIVEYKDVPHLGGGGAYTFQVHLYPSGRIEFHYQSMAGVRLDEATIGIQNETMDTGLAAAFNVDYVHDNLAIRFTAMPEWVTVSPSSGTIPAGGSVDLTIDFNAADMALGTHHGRIHVLTNDPAHPETLVPLAMTVRDYVAGAEALVPGALSLAQNVPNPFNPGTRIRFALPSRATVELRVYDVRGSLVRTLVTGELDAGTHDAVWDGRSDEQAQVPSGVYFYRLRTGGEQITGRMTLVR